MKKVLLALGLFLVVGAIFFVGKEIYINSLQEQNTKVSQEIFMPEGVVQKGPDHAEVEIVEFMDPQCESCRDFSVVVKEALNRYAGKVRLSIRYIPFHEHSRFAIKLLEASRRQNKYWEVLDVIFKYQDYWGSHHNAKPDLLWKFLPESGVDIAQLRSDIIKYESDYNKIIERDFADSKKLEIRATPSFFVNTKRLQRFGASPFFELIEAQLNAR